MLDPYSVIVRPVVSEKSTALGEAGKYVFEVAPTANKIQIKDAVEAAFAARKIEVASVNILQRRGKLRRLGRHAGMTRSWKKAVVTLRPGQRLDLFEGV
jgi:large subunit ribosomal protein L23